MASLEAELFDLILADKFSVFDLEFEVRTLYYDLYIAEFRKSRYVPKVHREVMKKFLTDIEKVTDLGAKEQLIRLYQRYEKPLALSSELGETVKE